MNLTLKIGSASVPVASVQEAQAEYCRLRDAGGHSASTWPTGFVIQANGAFLIAKVSYNGRVWDGADRPVAAEDVPAFDANRARGAPLVI